MNIITGLIRDKFLGALEFEKVATMGSTRLIALLMFAPGLLL